MRRLFCKYTDYEVFRQTKVILFYYFIYELTLSICDAIHNKTRNLRLYVYRRRHRRRNNSGCAFGGVQVAGMARRPCFRPCIYLQLPIESISRSGFITNSRSCMCGCGSVRSSESICTSSYISISMSIGRS